MKFSKLVVFVFFFCVMSSGPAFAQTIARVDVTADTTIIVVGQQVTAVARAKDADGNVIPNIQMTWSSRTASIATVDNNGLVTALFPGSVQITARASSGPTGTITFTVVPSRVEVTGNSTIVLNASTTLRARALDIGNNPIPNVTFTWASDNTAVITVTAAGVVQAVGLGEANISATVSGYIGRLTITVRRSQDFTLQTVVTSDGVQGPESRIQSIIAVSNINSRGDVAFLANLSGSTEAVIRDAGGQVASLARTGDPAPLGGIFSSFGQPVVNGRGDVAFIANVVNGVGPLLLLARGSDLTILLVSGDTLEAGGTVGGITLAPDGLDDNGLAYVTLSLSNPTYTGVFRVAADTAAAPLIRSFDELSIGAPTAFNAVSVSPGGRVAVFLSAGARRGIYIVTPTSAEAVLIDGQVVQGLGTFTSFQGIRSASDTDLFIMATVQGLSTSVYRASSSGITEAIRGGRQGTSNRIITLSTLLAGSGNIALVSATVSDIGTGLFSWTDGNLAPALLRTTAMADRGTLTRVDGGWVNSNGEIVGFGVTDRKLSAMYRIGGSGSALRWGTASAVSIAANYYVISTAMLRPTSSTTYFLAGVPTGLFKKTGETVTPIAVPGMTGPRGDVFTSVITASSNANGDVVLVANSMDLTRAATATVMYRYIANVLTEWIPFNQSVAISGLGNQTINVGGLGNIGFNNSQQAAFVGSVANRQSLFLAGSDLRVLLQVGAASPTGSTFTSFTNIQVTPSGSVVFTGGVSGAPGGLFIISNGQVISIANTTDFRGLGPPVVGGEFVYFTGGSGNITALWVYTNGVVQQVVQVGSAMATNTALTSFGSYSAQEDGSVVFVGNAVFTGIFQRRMDGTMSVLALAAEASPASGRFLTFGNLSIANSIVLVNSTLTQDRSGIFLAWPQGSQQTPISSTDFTVPNRATVSVRTDGQSGAITVGYANVRAASGSTSPAGLAIFSYRQGNILVSEATVPATIAVQAGRIYAEVSGPTNTGVAIANISAQAATINFYFTDASGQNFGSGTMTLPAGAQIAKFLTEAPFNGGSPISGTFTFTSSAPVSVIALRGYVNERSEFLITTLPVAPIMQSSTDGIIFPHFADGGGWKTQVILVNPTDDILSGSGLFTGAGTNTSFTYSIPPRGSFVFATAGAGSTTRTGWVRVTPGAGGRTPSGLLIFSFKRGGITVTEASVPATTTANAFRLYMETVGNVNAGQIGAMQTGIAIANPSPSAVTVTFDLSNLSGASTGTAGQVSVPAQSQIALFANQISGFQNLLVAQGVLRISSTAPVAVMGLRGRYNERGDFLITTVQPTNETAPPLQGDLYMPHFVDSGGYSTQFILYSGGVNQTSSGSLRFFSQSGQPLGLTLR